MPALTLAIAALAVVALAALFSLIGLGGGAAYVPVLVAAGMSIHGAATTSLFMIMAASAAMAPAYGRQGVVDWKLLLAVAPLAVVGAFAGGYAAQWVSAPLLKAALAAVLLLAAFLMLRPTADGEKPRWAPRWVTWDRECGGYRYQVALGVVVPAAAATSLVAGMVGVGGGVFMLPVLVLLAGCPLRISVGVTSLYTGLASFTGFLGHILAGDPFDVRVGLAIAAAAFVGARIGPLVSFRLDARTLRLVAALILMTLGAWMAASALGAV